MKIQKTMLDKWIAGPDHMWEDSGFSYNPKYLSNSEIEKFAIPLAHYIGTDNFNGEYSGIKTAIGLAGYFPVAHKDFNDFYGTLKGGTSDDLKFNSLKKRTEDNDYREGLYSDFMGKDIIISPWDSNYKPSERDNVLEKISRGELILDSLDLSRRIKDAGLKGKVHLTIYDKGFYLNPYLLNFSKEDLYQGGMSSVESGLNLMQSLSKKYGMDFVQKDDAPYPFLLYEHLRNKNEGLFKK